jgi:hypothetical protein
VEHRYWSRFSRRKEEKIKKTALDFVAKIQRGFTVMFSNDTWLVRAAGRLFSRAATKKNQNRFQNVKLACRPKQRTRQ